MKIGIQTWGSNGDIRPMLALGHGLRLAGHQVSLVVSSIDNQCYRDIAADLGLAYQQVPEHIAFDLPDFAQRALRMPPLQWLRALLDETFLPCEQEIYQAARQLAAEHDLLIGHHFLYPLKLAAKQQEKPFFSVTFCHAVIPTPVSPPFSLPNAGPHINQLLWLFLDLVFNSALKKPLSRLWLAAGETPPKRILTELLTSQNLNLIAVDPVFCPAAEHWHAHNQVCGFLNLNEDAKHWQIPDALQIFLDQGPAPIYMTLGSAQHAVPEWSMDLFLRAVELANCRAIIQTSSQRFPANSQTDQVYFIGKHPHQPLFKHCAAVVHHGGAGTTHAATRSACPSVVMPFMNEQMFWARQLQKLGVAGSPLPVQKVTAASLAAAICASLKSDTFAAKAKQLSLSMQAQDGIQHAVTLIETAYAKQKTLSA